jgi:hypothetical protein
MLLVYKHTFNNSYKNLSPWNTEKYYNTITKKETRINNMTTHVTSGQLKYR